MYSQTAKRAYIIEIISVHESCYMAELQMHNIAIWLIQSTSNGKLQDILG